MNKVIKEGVKTKVLMLSATPVNNRFTDLRNQLALAYEDDSENLSDKLRINSDIEKIFRQAQTAFNAWSKLPPQERTLQAILDSLDFDFFELLDSVTIARSRKHIQQFYDTSEIGSFPTRLPPKAYHPPLTDRDDVIDLNEIYTQLTTLQLAVYAPVNYILPSRLAKYEDMYDTVVNRGSGKLKQADRERSLQALMTTNLLKRLESSVEAFRQTLSKLQTNHARILEKIGASRKNGRDSSIADITAAYADIEPGEEEVLDPDSDQIGGKVRPKLSGFDF
jgi:DNA repair exonuclease SbcCD ATPase subunit